MRRSLRVKVLSMILVIFPAPLFGADTRPVAMLYPRGDTTLNGSSVARSSALFSGDLIETRTDSAANIDAAGSTVLILNESLVQYEGNIVALEHGGVRISTSRMMATRAGGVTVSPAAGVLTQFEVRDVDGAVRIAALKGDLAISDGAGTTTLAQGQETTRNETQSQSGNQPPSDNQKKKKKGAGGTTPGAQGGVFDSPVTVGIAGAVVAGGAIWVLTHSDNPLSPAKP